jgi:23S rRNA (uracil1939-C5)-methyltransferase
VCEALAAKPIAKTVVYVSCDPATLGRDLGTLLARYELRSLTAFEMFPHTGHIEVVAGLALTSSRPR